MKRVFAWAAAHLVAACYLLALALWALWALGNAGQDALRFAAGRLAAGEVPLSSLQSQDIALTGDGLWVTTGADPQFVFAGGRPVRSVFLKTDAPASGFEGYWAAAGQDFSLRRRVFAQGVEDGVLLVFPETADTIRIDPAAGAGVVLAQGEDAALTVNVPVAFWRYFVPRAEQALALAALPAAAAVLLDLGLFWKGRLLKKRG
ncbi:hypothetical protein [Candidatus Allofournierella excrementigallinarum]|uniref:hypothetical protein n=1 Tax=Candidatus Allofournierella excrementigallinarum TaxID=2838592 RepID=UPI00374FCE07